MTATIKASNFFDLNKMYYDATVYSVSNNVSFSQAQIALYGKVYFED